MDCLFRGSRGALCTLSPPPPVDDRTITEGLQRRDEAVVRAFLQRYRALIHHCISNFESDSGAREDLYQDLVMYVFQRLDAGSYDPDKGTLGTWLYRVAWCRCVDLKRKASARHEPRLAGAGEELPERADEHPSPDEAAGIDEIGVFVRRAMTELEPEERALLDLRFLRGQTLGQIASKLSISVEQTKYRLRRATVSLRRVLQTHYALEEA
ncbi:MAG: RNA polymerase sigma-70 factor (ECF subfamily) [Planctomycetota bacterium]|jgi:RNA polymerase sigma-70 factor (ECF subfamily)